MHFQCPSCGKTLAAGPEHFGKVVQCPHCREAIQVPAAPAPAPELFAKTAPQPAKGPAPEPTKKCPYCGETILKVARRCKFCKAEIPQGLDEESAAGRLKAKEELVAQQAASPNGNVPYSVWGWFRTSTLVVAALMLLSIISAAIGLPLGERSTWFFLGPVGIIFGVIFGVFLLIVGVRDVFAPKYFHRRTPLKGAKAFWRGLGAKRYRFAYYCVLDADKDESRRLRPAMIKFGVDAKSFSFDKFEGFRDYWKSALHSGGTQAYIRNIRLVRVQGDLAEVSADLKLTQQSTTGFLALGVLGALLFATNDSLPVKKLFRRVDGQWYAVNGELDSGEDRFGFSLRTE